MIKLAGLKPVMDSDCGDAVIRDNERTYNTVIIETTYMFKLLANFVEIPLFCVQ